MKCLLNNGIKEKFRKYLLGRCDAFETSETIRALEEDVLNYVNGDVGIMKSIYDCKDIEMLIIFQISARTFSPEYKALKHYIEFLQKELQDA